MIVTTNPFPEILNKIFLFNISSIEYNWDNIKKIGEFAELEKCEQNPKWHKEGNVWQHTKLVCNAAINHVNVTYDIENNERSFEKALILLTAALFHDIGKGVTTKIGKDGNWHSYNHEIEGEKITRRLLWDTGYEFREQVCALVRYHMTPLTIFSKKNYIKEIAMMSRQCDLYLLTKLKQFDLNGSIQEDTEFKTIESEKIQVFRDIALTIKEVADIIGKRKLNFEKLSEIMHKNSHPIELVMMIGLPGAGKDTYIKKHYDKNVNHVVISRDDIRVELGFCEEGKKKLGTEEEEKEVTRVFNEKLLQAAKKKDCIIIINNINLKKEHRKQVIDALSNYPLDITYVYIEADSIAENIKRREGLINPYAIKDLVNGIDWPLPDEYDTFIKIKN